MEPMEQLWDVFIAYASPNREAANQLFDLLQGACRVFMDKKRLAPGDSWDRELAAAQKGSRITAVLISSATETAHYQLDEIARGLELSRDQQLHHRVVPLYLDDTAAPYGLGRIERIVVSEQEGLTQAAHAILELIRTLDQEHFKDAGRTDTNSTEPDRHSRVQAPKTPLKQEPDGRVVVEPKGLSSFNERDSKFFLELLPGPRDETGLPESIGFWKRSIEATEETTFTVGLMYGPSGCGKTSLVKAGLLPQLAGSIKKAYVEASRDDTEANLVRELRKACPGLAPQLDLPGIIGHLSEGQALAPGQKVVIVLDQFEQWLHANRKDMRSTPLVDALGKVNGVQVKCLLMVRDEFVSAISNLFRELGVNMINHGPRENARPVALFDSAHARRVLELFGAFYKRLPADPNEFSTDQVRFLEQAVAGLSQNDPGNSGESVNCALLSLFAFMMKGRPWTMASLEAVGGTGGLGVKFLEESFTSRSALPELQRLHKQARAFLTELLPEQDTQIKGRMRSRAELAAACGLPEGSETLDRLIEILDKQLHIITLAEGEDSPEEGRYHLTHDLLVQSLRDWLKEEDVKTWRGRARLRLEALTTHWSRTKERRFLPTLLEYLSVVMAVPRKRRSPDEQTLMRAAFWFYGRLVTGIVSVATLLLSVLLWGWWDTSGAMQAHLVVQTIYAAAPEELERLIQVDLPPCRRWADPMLRKTADGAETDAVQRRRASLALVPIDDQYVDFLAEQLLVAEVVEFAVMRNLLAKHLELMTKRLWQELDDLKAKPDRRFRAGCALASYDPESSHWARHGDFLARQLVTEPAWKGKWEEFLRPVRIATAPTLTGFFLDRNLTEERLLATNILADHFSDDHARLLELLKKADARQFNLLFPRLEKDKEKATASLVKELSADFAENDSQAKEQANVAVALLRLGKADTVWPLFRHRRDPSRRSYLIHYLGPRQVAPELLARRWYEESDLSARRALLLALGEYSQDLFGGRKELIADLLKTYENHADAGIHSAIEWLLTRWDRSGSLRAVDQMLAIQPSGHRQWLVAPGGHGHTLAIVQGPVTFKMGSTEREENRDADAPQHTVRIPRTFAVATKEVTFEQFTQFCKATGEVYEAPANYVSDVKGPVIQVTWLAAARYCRWLSDQDQSIPEDQKCYPPLADIKEGMALPSNYLSRTGYRLPTEAEWEYACRAEASTVRPYGTTEELLDKYAWYIKNSEDRTHRVGMLKPNDLGMFDMLGNAWEWVQGRKLAYPSTAAAVVRDDVEDSVFAQKVVLDNLTVRGGGFGTHARSLRSAHRHPFHVTYLSVGFRIARTIR